jgi:ParB/RepB/Spo0J family partition protein
MPTKSLAKTPTAAATTQAPNKAAGGKAKAGAREVIVTGLGNASSALDELLGKLGPEELPAGARFIETVDIQMDQIVAGKGNPRKSFDQAKLQRLANSIKKIGQSQPGGVRRLPNGEGYEIIFGERRWRACALAGLKTYRASVYEVDIAALVEMRVDENESRDDLNPIEKATSWQQLLDDAGYSQTSLAAKLGITQGEVSNTVRLLKLPVVWQQRIISGEIPPSEGRCLAPWSDSSVIDQINDAFVSTSKYQRSSFEDFVQQCLWRFSRPLKDSSYGFKGRTVSIDLKPTEAQRAELDIRQLKDWRGQTDRCFNIAKWDELVEVQVKKREATETKKREKELAESPHKKKTIDDLKVDGEKLCKRIFRYKVKWMQGRVKDRVEHLEEDELVRFLIGLIVTYRQIDWLNRISAIAQNHGNDRFNASPYETGVIWKWAMGLETKTLFDLIRDLVAGFCEIDSQTGGQVHPEAIQIFADLLGVEIDTDWAVDDEYLQLHTIEQLTPLMKEWGVSGGTINKSGMITAVLSAATVKKLPAPQELLEVKPCRLD